MKRGKILNLHGAFKTKAKAKRKERQASNRFILKRKIKGKTRFIVASRRR